MKNICVIGDSFCAYRSTLDHWPKKLANLLNLNLIGSGLSGESWWFVRQAFLRIVNSKEFDDTELFVFCHTQPDRIIGPDSTIQRTNSNQPIVKSYLMHFENKEFNNWACNQWFLECNKILDGRKVIHLENFNTTKNYFKNLNGIRVTDPTLFESSVGEFPDFPQGLSHFLKDSRDNHFSKHNNEKLALFLQNIYIDYQAQWPNTTLNLTLA